MRPSTLYPIHSIRPAVEVDQIDGSAADQGEVSQQTRLPELHRSDASGQDDRSRCRLNLAVGDERAARGACLGAQRAAAVSGGCTHCVGQRHGVPVASEAGGRRAGGQGAPRIAVLLRIARALPSAPTTTVRQIEQELTRSTPCCMA